MHGEYVGTRRIQYDGGGVFVVVCPKCGRFVKPDEVLTFNGFGQPVGENATCARCGRVAMPFEGYIP